jgi:protein O-GlcNAc transferase
MSKKKRLQPNSIEVDKVIKHYQLGQLNQAISIASNLVRLYPDALILHEVLGASNLGLGNAEQAIKNYQKVIQLNPKHTDAYNNIGIVYFEQGNFSQAVESYEKVVELEPSFADAHYNLGNALKELGEIEKAIFSFRSALKINPNDVEVISNLGAALKDYGELDQAYYCYAKALEINPYYAPAHNNMGNVSQDRGDTDAAINSYKQAIKINPKYAEAFNNMGTALQDKGDISASIESYKNAIKIRPNYAEAHNNIGTALQEQGQVTQAINSYDQAIKIKPDYEAALIQKLYQKAHICDWREIIKDGELIAKLGFSNQGVEPFCFLPLEDAPKRQKKRAELYADRTFKQIPLLSLQRSLQKINKIKIGYFSRDFRPHPVAYLMAKVFESHDRNFFTVYGYSLGLTNDSDMKQRLTKAFDVFTDVKDMNDKEIALLARQDKIDIAIDLSGYTQQNRSGIFAYRAAPVQINYLGYPGTMGAPFIDYIIADQNLIPETSQQYYSEKPIYLPHHYQAQDDTLPIANNALSRSDLGLPKNGFVFCAINNSYKITPNEFNIWMTLLKKVKNSFILLLETNKWVKNNLHMEAAKRGVSCDRLIFVQKVPHEKYLAQFQLADLYLDTFIYNAGATASNALWAGLPVLTKTGNSYASRMASSLLMSIGLPELITNTSSGYEKLALEISSEPERLDSIKRKLHRNRLSKPLFNTKLFTTHLEEGYRIAYNRHRDGKEPAVIKVPM